MKAIYFPSKGQISFGELPDPIVGEDDVLVRVKTSGICHTDFEVLHANYGTATFPIVPGHEYAGVVEAVGPAVTSVRVGERVVVDPNFECGTCRACQRGWAHLCDNLGAYGVTKHGGFAELSCVKATAVQPIHDMEFRVAALAEPMGCVLNGVDAAFDPIQENALIFGAGPMGLLMGMALQTRGIGDITFADIDEDRLRLAESFGFNSVASGSDALGALHHSVDLVVEATGVPAVAGQLTEYIANGGNGLFFGVCSSDARIEISPFEVFRRQLTLAGSHSLNHNIPDAIETIKAFGSDIKRVVSHEMPIEATAEVFKSGAPRGSLKIQAVAE